MTFPRVKPAGWSFGERLTTVAMNQLDIDHANSLDGADGGNYTTSAPLSILGSGLGSCNVAAGSDFTFKGTVWPKLDSRTMIVSQPMGVVANINDRFTFNTTRGAWQQTSVASSGPIVVPVTRLLNSPATLTQVDVYLDGNGGGFNHSSLPASMPQIILQKKGMADEGDATTVGSQTDTSPGVAAYDNAHLVSLTGLSLIPTTTDEVYLFIHGESGANSVASALTVNGIRLHFTVTELRTG